MKKISKIAVVFLLSLVLIILLSTTAFASSSGSGMPWEAPLEKLLASLSGPVAKAIGTMAVIGTGLGLAFGEGGGNAKKLLMIVFGLSIAFMAASFITTVFGSTSGVCF